MKDREDLKEKVLEILEKLWTLLVAYIRSFFIRKWFIRRYYSAAQKVKKVQYWILKT